MLLIYQEFIFYMYDGEWKILYIYMYESKRLYSVFRLFYAMYNPKRNIFEKLHYYTKSLDNTNNCKHKFSYVSPSRKISMLPIFKINLSRC